MIRKVLSATIVLAMIGTNGTASYTAMDPITNIKTMDKTATVEIQMEEKNKVEIFQPENNLITSYKTVLLSGKAPEDSKVIVEVYSAPNFAINNTKNFDINNIDFKSMENGEGSSNGQEDMFLPPVIEEIEVGALGVFVQEVELKIGLNKINVYIEGSEEDAVVRFVHVNDVSKAEELIENIDSMGYLKAFKESFKKDNSEEKSLPAKEEFKEEPIEEKVKDESEEESTLDEENMEVKKEEGLDQEDYDL